MLISGSSRSKRTNLLIEYYNTLLEQGVSASKILVLCLNSYKKSQFVEEFKKNTKVLSYENPQIYTFYGLVYNTIRDNWPLIENNITVGDSVILPNMTGLEISEIFFKSAIKNIGFSDYNSKVNLIHQLFRRYSLAMNNNLSSDEIKRRSTILGETFAEDAEKVIDIYKRKTIEFRAFDYIRQLGLFEYVLNNSNCFSSIEYLILDDADEITPFELKFVKKLYPALKKVYIGYDSYGTSRMGFLNADSKTISQIESFFINEEKICLDVINYSPVKATNFSYSRRLEMVDASLNKVVDLINSGVKPCDISIITPVNDKALKYRIQEIFDKHEIKYQFLSGSEKLVSSPLVKNIITILKMSLGVEIDVYDYRGVLSEILKIPVKYCMEIVSVYKDSSTIYCEGIQNESYQYLLCNFHDVLQKISDVKMSLSEKILYLIKNLVVLDGTELEQVNDLSFFVKQIQDFEIVFNEYKTNVTFLKTVLTQFENSIISENSSSTIEINSGSVVVGTVQKVIDFGIRTKYQIWLDVSSNEWTKDDLGTIYNAWVFQKSWEKDSFTYEDNIELSTLKTKRQLRKLRLLCDEVFAYSSYFDIEGNENIGGINDYFEKNMSSAKCITEYSFVPRDDQKAILDYTNGRLAVSAVPGAGKTTVLLALIIKLLQQGVNSENIFVLTYMESAARNFKERIKLAIPDIDRMPNISTIHGLALRILKENSNHIKVGLETNFEVCDDNARQKILRESMIQLALNQDEYDKYEKGVSALKLSGAEKIPFVKDSELIKFVKLYNLYNKNLKAKNFVDYDDMLLLSVQLLENNQDILEYYQDICCYLIEDEAQDSSFVQQKLLNLLSGKHNNLVRCGDINQSITTTFTNADLDGFKNFVNNSCSVSMNKSQRCAERIYSLANKLIDYANSDETLKNAFYDIKMQGVDGKNPVSEKPICVKTFEDYKEEQAFILAQIKDYLKKNENSSIAILVRNNFQIEDYAKLLTENGYSVITRNDTLESQPVFSLIYSVLKFYAHPWDNSCVLEIMNILNKQNLMKFASNDFEYVTALKVPLVSLCNDSVSSIALVQLMWDLNYWLQSPMEDIESFAIKIGNYYYSLEIEKSNVYVVSLLLKNLYSQYKNFDLFLDKLSEISIKPVLSKYKFFDNDNKPTKNNACVQIMTYHKSKGDEFDCVFIPQLSEENLPLELGSIKIKSKERFLEAVKALNLNYAQKDELSLKKFIIEENLRLLYVAITRAKKKLYLTCSAKYRKFAKIKDTKVSILFDSLLKSEN